MTPYRKYLILALTAAFFSGAGCAPTLKHEYAEVTGTITYKGQPLESGRVIFQPDAGAAVMAEIELDGTYALKGAVGLNTVMITNRPVAMEPGSADPEERKASEDAEKAELEAVKYTLVPPKYGTPASGLTFQIEAGFNQADFDLN